MLSDVYWCPRLLIQRIDTIIYRAEKQDPMGQALLGLCYENGYSLHKDINKAFEYYVKSSEQNHPLGQVYLGICYEYGVGTTRNVEKAHDLYNQSAAQNHPHGHAMCGNFTESAAQGHPVGQALLGLSYEMEGQTGDAIAMYTLSAAQECILGQYLLSKHCNTIDLYNKIYRYKPNIFEDISELLPKYTSEELSNVYRIAQGHGIEEHIQRIKRFMKSKNYIKIARFIMGEDTKCSICYEQITEETVFLTKCLHYFHIDCVLSQTRCPLCRAALTEINC